MDKRFAQGLKLQPKLVIVLMHFSIEQFRMKGKKLLICIGQNEGEEGEELIW